MQHTASLAAISLLAFSLLAAVVSQKSHPDYLHNQPLWPSDVSLMLSLPGTPWATAPVFRHPYNDVHAHRSPGKPAADVGLGNAGLQSLALHEEKTIELQVQSHLGEGTLRVMLETSPDLQLLSSETEWRFELDGAETFQVPVTLLAHREGQHYVHLFVEHIDTDGTTSARALATEFRVGMPLVQKTYAKSFHMGSQDSVVSLPGRETIY